MATITQNSAGNWKAIIRKTGWPTTIKTFRTKRDAEDWARGVEDEMVRGLYIQRSPGERSSLKMALQRYLAEVTSTKKPATQTTEHKRAKPLLDHLGGYALAAITPDIVARYRDRRLDEGKSNDTVRLELALLGHLYNTAIREWRLGLAYNPVANIRRPNTGSGRDRRLNGDEEERLLAACDAHSNPMLGWIVRLAIETGMRSGEIISLRRNQIELSRRVIRLSETKNGSARSVPLSREAIRVLTEALNHPVSPLGTDLVFWGEPGRDKKRRPYMFQLAWRKALREAGITGLRFHDLRHEAVSRFVEAGLSDQEVAAISGHKSMQMLKRYTHLRAVDLVEKLDRVLG